MDSYSYPKTEPRFNLHLKRETASWSRYAVDFPIPQPAGCIDNNTGHGEYFRPNEGDGVPLVILIHGWGDHSVIPCRLLAKSLVKKGMACFILYLVFHSSRMPELLRKKGFRLSAEEWFEGYRMSVIDVRHTVDWAASVDGIDRKRIAVIGISLGGIIATIAMGVDERIGAGVFLVTGGNYESPTWIRRSRDRQKEADRREAEASYQHYLAQIAEMGFENVIPEKDSYLTDPMTFASLLRNRPTMMINARWDERIPRQASIDLWEKMGRPEIRWISASHAGIWLLYPYIRRQIDDFLSANFGI